MRCPHGIQTDFESVHGVRVFRHEDGALCSTLNDLDVPVGQIAALFMVDVVRALERDELSDHLVRVANSAYRRTFHARLEYFALLSRCSGDRLRRALTVLGVILQGADDADARWAYLIELYFAFDGLAGRFSLNNPVLRHSHVYRNLHGLGIAALPGPEDDAQRRLVSDLVTTWGAQRGRFEMVLLDPASARARPLPAEFSQ